MLNRVEFPQGVIDMPERAWARRGGICGLLSLRSMPGSAGRTIAEFLTVASRPETRLSVML